MNQDYDKIAEHIMKEYAPQYLKVQAIKYYREVTGVGLAEAKTAVEKIFEQYQKNGGTFPRSNTSTTAATTAFPNTSKGNAFKKDEEYYRRRTLGPVACGSLLLIGVVLFLMALVMFFIAPQKKKAEILEQVNAISEQDRERLLEKGYQEFVTDGNYVQKSTWYESPLGDMKDRLYIFQPVSGEGLCLGVLSEDKYFGYGTYCKGLAFYYKGEAPQDTVEADDDTVYEVMVVNLDDVKGPYGIASRKAEIAITDAASEAQGMGFGLCLSAVLLITMGFLGIKNRDKKKK